MPHVLVGDTLRRRYEIFDVAGSDGGTEVFGLGAAGTLHELFGFVFYNEAGGFCVVLHLHHCTDERRIFLVYGGYEVGQLFHLLALGFTVKDGHQFQLLARAHVDAAVAFRYSNRVLVVGVEQRVEKGSGLRRVVIHHSDFHFFLGHEHLDFVLKELRRLRVAVTEFVYEKHQSVREISVVLLLKLFDGDGTGVLLPKQRLDYVLKHHTFPSALCPLHQEGCLGLVACLGRSR